MRLVLTLTFAAALGIALSGCIIHAHGHPPHGAVTVVVPGGHVHSANCGHYHHRGRWYYWKGHVHGAGCGHAFKGGIWIIAD
jgi:hypothetical protein